jgi:hypothetical protein
MDVSQLLLQAHKCPFHSRHVDRVLVPHQSQQFHRGKRGKSTTRSFCASTETAVPKRSSVPVSSSHQAIILSSSSVSHPRFPLALTYQLHCLSYLHPHWRILCLLLCRRFDHSHPIIIGPAFELRMSTSAPAYLTLVCCPSLSSIWQSVFLPVHISQS